MAKLLLERGASRLDGDGDDGMAYAKVAAHKEEMLALLARLLSSPAPCATLMFRARVVGLCVGLPSCEMSWDILTPTIRIHRGAIVEGYAASNKAELLALLARY